MTVPKAKNKPLESSTQVTEQNEILFKKEHKEIYDYFVKVLEVKAELKKDKGITDYFILAYKKILLTNVNPEEIRPLSEENFCQFLLSVFKEVREKNLANKENVKNVEIKKLVDDCVADIRGTEAKDSFIKFVLEMPLLLIGGIKIDPKNISGSFMDGVKEKIPFLGGDKKEEDEPLLSDEEMVIKFLYKVFLPILFSIASILIFGPTTLAIVAAVIGTIFAVKGGVEVLFSNNRPGTLYDPSSPDKDDTEKREKLNEKIRNGIDDILKTEIKEITEQISQGDGENKQHFTSERVCSPRKETPATLKQPTLDQPAKSTGQQTDLPNM
ncbi:hypothetical protein HGO53_02485 [Wolbachia endosymbiont of Diaphorina citri]|jgi:hypothetical protein|uniref:hypothetical protein n=1 Tax=Wolbachia endosymbiont of Diaphorina citri TaxID=116598 RepID=UPI0002FE2FA1|nr:hypothetical protein [Wolbachia endosymbiont of Diaphorina citri]QJT94200.1 hypothetical protein HGO48_01775 [Wolbachia endosymbiont of Diaphorina citri]QJT95441.1 hypothetical protein HGO49_01775 [Wolbachia endosymbiont of Diaphorina citri]QJT96802.1 hypothetical protein HGO53_02485 [Wolbachia endosymbiont of Diaphorina citri]QLK11097.1 hypothetical protein FK497_01815 [Wolbachia endosymbiont of Diaphorina citri]QXY87371.1 hypothetical protein GZ064_05965 [Wolbachia endosymbiont of Diaphor